MCPAYVAVPAARSTIAYNGERLIEVNMTSEVAVPIEAGRTYDLTYSVRCVHAGRASESC